MSKNISDLLNNTFDNGTIHIKYLEQLIKMIVQKLDFSENNFNSGCHQTSFSDPISKLMTSTNVVTENYCNDKISMTEVINFLNITKRVEALEISIQKITTIVQNIMKKNGLNFGEDSDNKMNETISEEEILEDRESLSSKYFDTKDVEPGAHKSSFDWNEKLMILEEGFKKLNDDLRHIIERSDADFQNQICEIEKQITIVDEKFKDIFYACEQNEEKIDATILSIDDFKSNFFCLKSEVSKLLDQSEIIDNTFTEIVETCNELKELKAEQSVINDVLLPKIEAVSFELSEIERKYDCCQIIEVQKSFHKLQDDIKSALKYLKVQVDEKMEKNVFKDFKKSLFNNFDEFIQELKIILTKKSGKNFALGTSECKSNLSCISCQNNVLMKTELNYETENQLMENSTRKYKRTGLKYELNRKHTLKSQQSNCSPISFPISQQCFIISPDNTIYKADPLKCLINPNYTKIN